MKSLKDIRIFKGWNRKNNRILIEFNFRNLGLNSFQLLLYIIENNLFKIINYTSGWDSIVRNYKGFDEDYNLDKINTFYGLDKSKLVVFSNGELYTYAHIEIPLQAINQFRIIEFFRIEQLESVFLVDNEYKGLHGKGTYQDFKNKGYNTKNLCLNNKDSKSKTIIHSKNPGYTFLLDSGMRFTLAFFRLYFRVKDSDPIFRKILDSSFAENCSVQGEVAELILHEDPLKSDKNEYEFLRIKLRDKVGLLERKKEFPKPKTKGYDIRATFYFEHLNKTTLEVLIDTLLKNGSNFKKNKLKDLYSLGDPIDIEKIFKLAFDSYFDIYDEENKVKIRIIPSKNGIDKLIIFMQDDDFHIDLFQSIYQLQGFHCCFFSDYNFYKVQNEQSPSVILRLGGVLSDFEVVKKGKNTYVDISKNIASSKKMDGIDWEMTAFHIVCSNNSNLIRNRLEKLKNSELASLVVTTNEILEINLSKYDELTNEKKLKVITKKMVEVLDL